MLIDKAGAGAGAGSRNPCGEIVSVYVCIMGEEVKKMAAKAIGPEGKEGVGG